MKTEFSKENVEKLNELQKVNQIHPYTCYGNDVKECKRRLAYEDRKNGKEVPYTNDNEGVLVATEIGWVCPCGKFVQYWF